MKALVLETKGVLRLRDFPLEEGLGPHDVRVRIHTVGICGSDVHYYQHGAIGPFVVRAPLVLGHEASGIVLETGAAETAGEVMPIDCTEMLFACARPYTCAKAPAISSPEGIATSSDDDTSWLWL